MYRIVLTRRAEGELERATAWWRANRPDAPGAILDDFEQAKRLLSSQPSVGARAVSRRYSNVRRIFLSRVRYHVYYRISPGLVVVLAFWHGSRGKGPSV